MFKNVCNMMQQLSTVELAASRSKYSIYFAIRSIKNRKVENYNIGYSKDHSLEKHFVELNPNSSYKLQMNTNNDFYWCFVNNGIIMTYVHLNMTV